jgi:hypothetical protein
VAVAQCSGSVFIAEFKAKVAGKKIIAAFNLWLF